MKDQVIAIDGPSASGKSTIGKMVASKLNFYYVDTGAMYRAITFYLLQKVPNNNEQELRTLLEQNEETLKSWLDDFHMRYDYSDGRSFIYLNDLEVSDKLRSESVSRMSSIVSSYPIIRRYLLDFQRELAKDHQLVMDGRDIGSVIFPKARLKVYLTASIEARAKRRVKDLDDGQALQEVMENLKQRDQRDRNREHAPLLQVHDAHLIDSSNMTLQEVVDRIISYYHQS